jgi:high-affinity Fe2+/Pb2+ permease
LEKKLREISGDLEDTVESKKPRLLAGAVVGVLVIVVLAYLVGRRRGRKPVVVELRRV